MPRCPAIRVRRGETPPMKLSRSWTGLLPMTPRMAMKDSKDTHATDTKETFPEPGRRSLRLRLLLTVILAPSPAAIVNVIEGVDRIQQDMSAARERLIQTAGTAAASATDSIQSAEQILHTLATRPEVRRAEPGCAEAVTNALQGYS